MKKSTVKTTASKSVKMDCSGDRTRSNVWFKIGLSRSDVPMLKTISRRIFAKPQSSAVSARLLLLSALAHYDVLEPLIFADADYSDKEGFYCLSEYQHGVIEHQHAKISGAKKGSRK